jgi:acetolactate synthase-1/2/3 large subunit
MGYGIPAALGARVARPAGPIVAVVGDGGFQMSALELATTIQEKLPIVILLVNDSCLTLIKATQERHYPGRYVAVDLHNPDFVRLAEAFNVPARRCHTEAEVESALRTALTTTGPSLVEVVIGQGN